jgi:hypothetical protein
MKLLALIGLLLFATAAQAQNLNVNFRANGTNWITSTNRCVSNGTNYVLVERGRMIQFMDYLSRDEIPGVPGAVLVQSNVVAVDFRGWHYVKRLTAATNAPGIVTFKR